MALLIALCGFVGGWLLFAGPVFQAALELDEEELEREDLAAAAKQVAPPRRVSPWWWLLPPVGFVLQRRRSRAYQQAVLAALPAPQLEQFVTYVDKATGWLMVALGGLLIAAKETAELGELLELPGWAIVALVVVAALLSASYTAVRMRRRSRLLGEEPGPPRRVGRD